MVHVAAHRSPLRRLLVLSCSAALGLLIAGLILYGMGAPSWRTAYAEPIPGGKPKLTTSTKTVTPTVARGGNALTYTIHIVNTGAWTATATTLRDRLPEPRSAAAAPHAGGARLPAHPRDGRVSARRRGAACQPG